MLSRLSVWLAPHNAPGHLHAQGVQAFASWVGDLDRHTDNLPCRVLRVKRSNCVGKIGCKTKHCRFESSLCVSEYSSGLLAWPKCESMDLRTGLHLVGSGGLG